METKAMQRREWSKAEEFGEEMQFQSNDDGTILHFVLWHLALLKQEGSMVEKVLGSPLPGFLDKFDR